MIRDPTIKADIARQWQALTGLANKFLMEQMGFQIVAVRPRDESYNLPFLLAYSVLDQVLSELANQGVFSCGSWMLGPKMAASQSVLPWQDYALIDRGKQARNDLAHGGTLVAKSNCVLYINAIEAELSAWGVL